MERHSKKKLSPDGDVECATRGPAVALIAVSPYSPYLPSATTQAQTIPSRVSSWNELPRRQAGHRWMHQKSKAGLTAFLTAILGVCLDH